LYLQCPIILDAFDHVGRFTELLDDVLRYDEWHGFICAFDFGADGRRRWIFPLTSDTEKVFAGMTV
jgi:hypothetical protein